MKFNLFRNVAGVISGVLVANLIPIAFNYLFPELAYTHGFGQLGFWVLNAFYAGVGGYITLKICTSKDIRYAIAAGTLLAISAFTTYINFGMYIERSLIYAAGNIVGAIAGGWVYLKFTGTAQHTSPIFTNYIYQPNSNSLYGDIAMEPKNSEATRYLASSVILNGSLFRSQILNYIKRKYKAYAPELGYDLETVARLCEYFENREIKYNVVFFILAFLLILTISGPFVLLIFLVAWILRFFKGYTEHILLLENFKKGVFDPENIQKKFNGFNNQSLPDVIESENQNLIIYNDFSPFIGAGINMGGWSFAVDIATQKEELGEKLEIKSFTLADLYNEISHSFKDLKFKGLKVKHTLFVNGSDIRDQKWILPSIYSTPITQINDNRVFYKYVVSNDPRIRYYLWIQVFDWGNELVVSYFLRYSIRGKKLFVEVSKYLLTPLSDSYKKVDKLVPYDFFTFFTQGFKYLIFTPFTIVWSIAMVFGKIVVFISELFEFENRRLRKMIKSNPLFNYGAEKTLREGFSSQRYSHYFQLLDKEMYCKIIEKELFDTFVHFLDKHNIDTSELMERQTSIINQGVIVTGGDIKTESMAVGTGAKAKKSITNTLSGVLKNK